jgi:hypothetical protein
VKPRAGLDAVVKRKIPSPRRESNPRTPIVHPVALHHFSGSALDSKLHSLDYDNLFGNYSLLLLCTSVELAISH